VTIPAGSGIHDLYGRWHHDHTSDGVQHADIIATADGFGTGVRTIGVTDVDLPDLQVTSVVAPTFA